MCGGSDEEGTIRVCECCDAPYHCGCHRPPLMGLYESGDWVCSNCTPIRETGVEEGKP